MAQSDSYTLVEAEAKAEHEDEHAPKPANEPSLPQRWLFLAPTWPRCLPIAKVAPNWPPEQTSADEERHRKVQEAERKKAKAAARNKAVEMVSEAPPLPAELKDGLVKGLTKHFEEGGELHELVGGVALVKKWCKAAGHGKHQAAGGLSHM